MAGRSASSRRALGLFRTANRGDSARASEAYRDLTVLRQFVESSACPTLFDALWAPLFLSVLFLVHPLLGLIGACSVLLLFGLAVAGDVLTEDALARSGAALSRSHGRFATTVQYSLDPDNGDADRAARLIFRSRAGRAKRTGCGAAAIRDHRARRQAGTLTGAGPDHGRGRVACTRLQQKSRHHLCHHTAVQPRARTHRRCRLCGWKAFATALSAYRRLTGVLAVVPAVPENTRIRPNQPEGRLIVDNVGLELPGSGRLLVKGVSFSLAPGECLGIIGPSGSGKSALGQVITGISTPTQGCVLLDNVTFRSCGTGEAVASSDICPRTSTCLEKP